MYSKNFPNKHKGTYLYIDKTDLYIVSAIAHSFRPFFLKRMIHFMIFSMKKELSVHIMNSTDVPPVLCTRLA